MQTTAHAPLDVETTTGSGERFAGVVERALSKFLALPLGILAGFLIAGAATYALDRADAAWIQPLRRMLQDYVFSDPQTTGDFLGAAAGGLFTQTSIVISMLLLVLQNTAANMGNLVYDHFMERRRNQVYVGYVTGAVVLAYFVHSTVSETFNPVLGGTLVLLVTFLSVALLAWFLYSTMNQMKPEVVVGDIHSTAMQAREKELRTLARTRRESISEADVLVVVRSTDRGYVTRLNLDTIDDCLQSGDPATEMVVHAAVGEFVSYRDILAEIRSRDIAEAQRVAGCVGEAFTLAREREPDYDSRFNLLQLEVMGWTEASSSKQNPETALMVVHTLRDLLRRWALMDLAPADVKEPVAVVYPDRVVERVVDAFESLAVASVESMQHQVFAEVLEALALSYRDLPRGVQQRVDSMLRRVVPGLRQHFYTVRLQDALNQMVQTLHDVGDTDVVNMLVQARAELAQTAGSVPGANGGSGGGGGTSS
jgi:uncharacterized membrane protein